jgi:hypothetical protein
MKLLQCRCRCMQPSDSSRESTKEVGGLMGSYLSHFLLRTTRKNSIKSKLFLVEKLQ